jgi:uncharacterized protein YsxB (DUF464 family)
MTIYNLEIPIIAISEIEKVKTNGKYFLEVKYHSGRKSDRIPCKNEKHLQTRLEYFVRKMKNYCKKYPI